jgi:hypothetical protein
MRRQHVVWRTVIRPDLVRSATKILDGHAKRSRNSLTLMGPRHDDLAGYGKVSGASLLFSLDRDIL